jgi:hypothetical protein
MRGSPFIEGSRPFLLEHGNGAVASAAVLAQGRVHISRLDHVDRGGDDGGAEARPKGGSEMAREVICQGAAEKVVSSPCPWFQKGRALFHGFKEMKNAARTSYEDLKDLSMLP